MQPTKRQRIDKTDRMLHLPFFLEIEQMTKPFTLDACADPNGYNAQCSRYCSLDNNFLLFDCSHHHVWINPPFQLQTMRQIIQHYLHCKRRSSHTTSACILLPKWTFRYLFRYLLDMTLIKTYPAFQPVMTVPTIPPSKDQLQFLHGLPFPLQVFYDPPKPETYEPPVFSSDLNKLALIAPFLISGSRATINATGKLIGHIAIDTLASRNFIDEHFLQQIHVRIKRHPPWLSNEITLGDNTKSISKGVVHIHLQMESYSDMIWCDVLQLPKTFQLILGQEWLNKHNCILNFKNKTCTLRHNGRQHLIHCSPHDEQHLPSAHVHYTSNLPMLSALQVKRALRKPTLMDTDRCFFVLVQQLHDKLLASTPIDDDVQAILDRHKLVFDDPPSGLPPKRNIVHRITLPKDASPPFKPIYRLSLTERKEVQTTIEDLLQKQLIQPSTSPFGAPILFVGKKDGTLRMCVDYRALNKLTVKNRYPLPRIDDLLDQLYGARYFTTLDLASGYHQIRVHDKDIQKTAFRTPLGHFEWRVMPFGLCNAPATFQNAMNNLFGNAIGQYVLVYMDDILIFSKTKEDHLRHLDHVLALLKSQHYYVKISKCHFMQEELNFLGHTISAKGLSVDRDKIKIIEQWQPPSDKSGIRSLLGFGNYFRRFIYKYSEMVLPLLELTKSNTPTTWTDQCQLAFEQLKTAIINAPVLQHPDLTKSFKLVCDASNYATGAILMQDDHPCAFASKKLLPAECNYTTEEKELLAVIHALKLFRCYLEGNHFTICTDHNPLKYFDTKQDLSPRQARWAQYLSRFDYTWEWIKGQTNPADFLSRNPIFATLFMATTRSQSSPSPTLPSSKPRKRKHQYSADHSPLSPPTTSKTPVTTNSPAGCITHELIQLGYQHDRWFQRSENTQSLKHHNNLWYHDKAIVLPKYLHLRRWAMEEFHEPPYSGHLGFNKTLQNLKTTYWWYGMTANLKEFINSCHSCQRNKPYLQKPAGLLQPLPIPPRPWSSISMDFIVELPPTQDGYNSIITVVDRLTKMVHFIPCTTTITAQQLASLFLNNIFKLHGVPQDIISDRDRKFVSIFWKEFCKLLGTKQNMSTPYHPETDGQTERMNRILEEMLRHYVASHQQDWDKYLSTCEFAINNAVQDSTGYSPFYLTYGYNPLTPATLASPSSVPAAAELHQQIFAHLKEAKQHLQAAQQRQKSYTDVHRRVVHYSPGDQVLLSTQHIGLYCAGSPKLLPRYIGPFTILKRVGELAYQLQLPSVLRIHDVFHVSRLRSFKDDGRVQPPPLPVTINNELEYEIDHIYAHRDVKVGKNRTRREYLVRWKGYTVEHDEYVPEANLGNAKGKIAEYWKMYES